MYRSLLISILIFGAMLLTSGLKRSENSAAEPWKPEQLLEPSELAQSILKGKKKYIIYSIGPAGLIKDAVDVGAARDEANLNKLKEQLRTAPKNQDVVIY